MTTHPNPYAPTDSESQPGVYGSAERRKRGFLLRTVVGSHPFPLEIAYTGWWFVQRVTVNKQLCWWKISWLRIEKDIQVELPVEVDPECRPLSILIEFSPGLWIRRFQIWVNEDLIYDEIGA